MNSWRTAIPIDGENYLHNGYFLIRNLKGKSDFFFFLMCGDRVLLCSTGWS